MTEEALRFFRLAGFAIAIVVALAWQRLSPHARVRGSTRVNAGLWLVNAAVMGAVCGACVCSAARWASSAEVGLFNQVGTPAWIVFPAAVVFLDLVSYAWHRATHAVPLLWRCHQVHHSDTSFTVSTALRFHPGELLLSLPLRLVAVVLLGAPAEAVVLFEVTFTLANAVEHGDIDLPRRLEASMENVLVTPALHRWHHTTSIRDRDTNFGTIFSIWDRLFGTYAASASDAMVRTGLPDLTGVTLADALRLPLRRAV